MTVRTVIIGMGYRGRALLKVLREIPFFEVVGVADPKLSVMPDPDRASYTDSDRASFAQLQVYPNGPEDYRRMLVEQRPELAVICSPWNCHVQQAKACLEAGCNVALEIAGGLEEAEYQPLMGLPGKVYPLENLIFRRDLLAVREMARAGLFGELVYLQGGYRHDLRGEIIDSRGVLGGEAPDSRSWRGKLYTTENADIYPTHSMAPLCMIADIHRIATVSASASKALGLAERLGSIAQTVIPETPDQVGSDAPVMPDSAGLPKISDFWGAPDRASLPHITLGDIVSTHITTPDGKLLHLVHDTTLPRPKGFNIEVQGTRGIWEESGHRIYIEGRSPYEAWESDAPYIEEFLDPYWRRYGAEAAAKDPHHGGMDYIMFRAIEEDLRLGAVMPDSDRASHGTDAASAPAHNGAPAQATLHPYPVTLADLALWASVTPLSSRSIAEHRSVEA